MCSSCQSFQLGATKIFEADAQFDFQLHQNRQILNNSAGEGCLLCSITADAVDQAEERLKSHGVAQDQSSPNGAPGPPVSLNISLRRIRNDNDFMISFSAKCGGLSIELDTTTIKDDDFVYTCNGSDEPDTSTGSASAMKTAMRWLRSCRDDCGHHACLEANRNQAKGESLPRRLLFIAELDQPPRLVEGQYVQAPYCALSYCWGTIDFQTTTRSNLMQSQEGIPLNSIPTLLRDAIAVARTLGYQYIWIDALCIVQDDLDDWAHEAARMSAIYSNANLTISTLAASDCHTSLFQPRKFRVVHPVQLDIWMPKRKRRAGTSLAVVPEWVQRNPTILGPVHSRGWTVQEQLLSPRILWFGLGILQWECLDDYWFEADPSGDNRRMYNYRQELEELLNTKRAIKASLLADKDRSEMLSGRPKPFDLWKMQVEEFTRRKLTKSSDRLAAFLSISEILASAEGNKYLCGIWNGDRFLESLCWRVSEHLPGTGMSNLPSCTWAAADGKISYDLIDRAARGDVKIIPEASMVALDIQANESNSSGSITLKTTLCRKKPFIPSKAEDGHFSFEDLIGEKNDVFLDSNYESIEDCYTISIFSFPTGPPHEGYGYPVWPEGRPPSTIKLLVRPVSKDLKVFQRVGVGIMSDTSHTGVFELEDGEKLTPRKWLMIDEEVFENREVIII